MRSRLLAATLLALTLPAAACQLVWSYNDFKDQPGTGGSGGSGGNGGSPTHSSTSITSTIASSSTTSSTSGSGCFTSASASSGGGDAGCPNGAPTGMACMGCCDQMLIAERQCSSQDALQDEVYNCTVAHLGDQNGAQACVAKNYDYSTACSDCLAALGQCGYAHCWPSCFNQVDTPGCNACLAANCDSDFTMCSGIIRPEAMDGGVDAPCD